MRPWIGCILLAATLGCGAHEHRSFGTEVKRPSKGGAPSTAPALPRAARRVEIAVGPSPGVSRDRAVAVATGVRDALERTGRFEHVFLATGPAAPTATAGAPARLELDVTRFQQTEEAGDAFVPAVVAYLFIGPWTNWFHERECRLDTTLRYALRDGYTGATVVSSTAVRAGDAQDLSFWERRGGVWPTIATVCWIPPMVFASDPARTEAILAPAAYDEAAEAIVRAVEALRTREIELLSLRRYPLDGLDAVLVQPAEGTPPRGSSIALRLSGPRVPDVRRVWIERDAVFDASRTPLAANAREILVGRALTWATRKSNVPILVELEGAPPFALAEVATVRAAVLDRAR